MRTTFDYFPFAINIPIFVLDANLQKAFAHIEYYYYLRKSSHLPLTICTSEGQLITLRFSDSPKTRGKVSNPPKTYFFFTFRPQDQDWQGHEKTRPGLDLPEL